MAKEIKWLDDVEEKDYKAALNYFQLLLSKDRIDASGIIVALFDAEILLFKARDILRASGLKTLPKDDPQIIKDLEKIANDEPLSPVLIVRDPISLRPVVLDGYHRICACWHHDYNAEVPAKIL